MRYFHGGVPGLRPGDLITPHTPNVIDGCAVCEARATGRTATIAGGQPIDPPTGRSDHVYITTDRDYARWYASRYWLGDLYTVEPVGDVEPSTEDLFPTWCAAAARVTSVYTRAVRLTPPPAPHPAETLGQSRPGAQPVSRAHRGRDQPTVEQIRSLLGHAESRALTTTEAGRLRSGVEHLIASQTGLAAEAARLTRQLANGARPALDVECPTCQAAIGCPCINRFGHPIPAPHARRLNAAALPIDHRNST